MTLNEIQTKIDSIRDRQRPFDSQRAKLLALDANEAASLEIALQLGKVVELLGALAGPKPESPIRVARGKKIIPGQD